MNEIKCPHCGGMFTIDEAGFAAILKQVRDAEFDKEVRRHEELDVYKRQAKELYVMAGEARNGQGASRFSYKQMALYGGIVTWPHTCLLYTSGSGRLRPVLGA